MFRPRGHLTPVSYSRTGVSERWGRQTRESHRNTKRSPVTHRTPVRVVLRHPSKGETIGLRKHSTEDRLTSTSGLEHSSLRSGGRTTLTQSSAAEGSPSSRPRTTSYFHSRHTDECSRPFTPSCRRTRLPWLWDRVKRVQ